MDHRVLHWWSVRWVCWVLFIGLLSSNSLGLVGCRDTGTATPQPPDQAPIILDVPATRCEGSPNGAYMVVQGDGFESPAFTIYDMNTRQPVSMPAEAGNPGFWLRDTVWFNYAGHHQATMRDPPRGGWITDVAHGIVTDVLTLHAPEQDQVLQEIAQAFATYADREEAARRSPNGRYEAGGGFIIAYDAQAGRRGALNQRFIGAGATSGCFFGWKADSSGYYFIAHGAALFGFPPGPIRFLPVDPSK